MYNYNSELQKMGLAEPDKWFKSRGRCKRTVWKVRYKLTSLGQMMRGLLVDVMKNYEDAQYDTTKQTIMETEK